MPRLGPLQLCLLRYVGIKILSPCMQGALLGPCFKTGPSSHPNVGGHLRVLTHSPAASDPWPHCSLAGANHEQSTTRKHCMLPEPSPQPQQDARPHFETAQGHYPREHWSHYRSWAHRSHTITNQPPKHAESFRTELTASYTPMASVVSLEMARRTGQDEGFTVNGLTVS